MEILTSLPLKSAPLISGTEDYAIDFPTVGITHILELCCKDHVASWPVGAEIQIGFLAFDSHAVVNGDFDHSDFTTFVPMYDLAGDPQAIKKNCAVPVAPPRSGRLILRAVNMPDCYVSVHPNQETRPQSCVWLPSLQ